MEEIEERHRITTCDTTRGRSEQVEELEERHRITTPTSARASSRQVEEMEGKTSNHNDMALADPEQLVEEMERRHRITTDVRGLRGESKLEKTEGRQQTTTTAPSLARKPVEVIPSTFVRRGIPTSVPCVRLSRSGNGDETTPKPFPRQPESSRLRFESRDDSARLAQVKGTQLANA